MATFADVPLPEVPALAAAGPFAGAWAGYWGGVIPHVLVDKEIAHKGVQELHVVDTMHTRKRLMGELADAFVILPAGLAPLRSCSKCLPGRR